jgi:hypothetical protein
MPDTRKRERPVVVNLREAQPAVLFGDFDPERADLLEPVDHAVGDLRVTLDLERVNLGLQEHPQGSQETLALLNRLGIQPRLRIDQLEPKIAEKQLFAEARQLPLRLARRLNDIASLLLRNVTGHGSLLLLNRNPPHDVYADRAASGLTNAIS